MTDLDTIRYMANTNDSLEAQACHMLADAVSALQARVAALEAASKPAQEPIPMTLERAYVLVDADLRSHSLQPASKPTESPVMVTTDRVDYDKAMALLRRAMDEAEDTPTNAVDHIEEAINWLHAGQHSDY